MGRRLVWGGGGSACPKNSSHPRILPRALCFTQRAQQGRAPPPCAPSHPHPHPHPITVQQALCTAFPAAANLPHVDTGDLPLTVSESLHPALNDHGSENDLTWLPPATWSAPAATPWPPLETLVSHAPHALQRAVSTHTHTHTHPRCSLPSCPSCCPPAGCAPERARRRAGPDSAWRELVGQRLHRQNSTQGGRAACQDAWCLLGASSSRAGR